jgi:hypothetical protein
METVATLPHHLLVLLASNLLAQFSRQNCHSNSRFRITKSFWESRSTSTLYVCRRRISWLIINGLFSASTQFVVNMSPRGGSFATPDPRAGEHCHQEDAHVLDHEQPCLRPVVERVDGVATWDLPGRLQDLVPAHLFLPI